MSESEQLLVMALGQYGCLPAEPKIEMLSQIRHEDFGFIIIKICKKIAQLKTIDMEFPDAFPKEMSRKYQLCQKIVEFIKSLGYKSDININNILFPSQRDMQRIFEFTLEIITSNDAGAEEIDHGTEKNYTKIKFGKILSGWSRQLWVLPELNKNLYQKDTVKNEYMLKFPNTIIKQIKKITSANSDSLTEEQIQCAKDLGASISASSCINFIQEEDNALLKYATGEKNHNYIINKLKEKNNKGQADKGNTQEFSGCITSRNKAVDFLSKTYKENNFENNVHIIKKKNQRIYGFLSSFSTSALNSNTKSDNQETSVTDTSEEEKNNLYKSKIDNIIQNFEKEKQQKNEEINELNNKLLNIVNTIKNYQKQEEDNIEMKKKLEEEMNSLSRQNNALLQEIEDQMAAFEQMKKLQNNEVIEGDIVDEVAKLSKKYEDMVSQWEEYTVSAKKEIEDLKADIDTKKKEYQYKFEQISVLKKEIEEISNKISMKQELAQFLNEEYQKIPSQLNRNVYVNKIAELTKSIQNEKMQIAKYFQEIKITEHKINQLNENIQKIDNEFEDLLFKDAKAHSKLKPVYEAFIKLREGYNLIQKDMLDMNSLKNKMKDLENKVLDYKAKLKSYDYEQLKEQVNFLKNNNQ